MLTSSTVWAGCGIGSGFPTGAGSSGWTRDAEGAGSACGGAAYLAAFAACAPLADEGELMQAPILFNNQASSRNQVCFPNVLRILKLYLLQPQGKVLRPMVLSKMFSL